MAGGPNAAFAQCRACARDAHRTSEGIENDWYECEACGAEFGIDWSNELDHAFYRGKAIADVEWWVDSCALPEFRWARLRLLNDGTADTCFEEGGVRYGFADIHSARHFLADDEYVRQTSIESDANVVTSATLPPRWKDFLSQPFEYLGEY